MKKFLRYILPVVAFAMIMASCEKEEKVFSDESHVAFEKASSLAFVQETSPVINVPLMFVGASDGQEYQVSFAIKDAHGNVTTNVTEGVEIGTISGVNLNSDDVFAQLAVNVNFDALEAGKRYTLILELVDGGGLQISPSLNPVFVLQFQQYIPLDPTQFEGTFDVAEYSGSDDATYNYQASIELLEVLYDGKGGKYRISYLWPWIEAGVEPLEFILDDRDPSAPLLLIETQPLFMHATYGQATWSTSGNGAFDVTLNKLTFPVAAVEVAAGYFDQGIKVVATKAADAKQAAAQSTTRMIELK
ncbi:MAG: hypothetical protein R6U64_01510 [Bacteroidales bacterium]